MIRITKDLNILNELLSKIRGRIHLSSWLLVKSKCVLLELLEFFWRNEFMFKYASRHSMMKRRDKIIIPINMLKKSSSQRTIALNFGVSRELIYSLRRELRRKAKTKWEPYPKEIQRKNSINQRHWILLRALRQIIFTGVAR